jgi:acetyl esterase/lipase
MIFANLPPQTPINPRADAYGAVAVELSRSAASRLRVALDLRYGAHSQQALDIYMPDDPGARDVPVMVYFHGGGWTHGYKAWCGFNALPLVNLPAILVSVDYRLAPDHRLPAAIEDACDAIAWVWRHVRLFGGDPDRIVIGGHSAGGHTVAMVGVRPELLQARGLPADVVKACMPVSCSYNVVYENVVAGSGEDLFQRHVLRQLSDAPGLSPIHHVAQARCPFFITWGSEDTERARVRGPHMIEALRQAGIHVENHVFPTFDHFEIHLDQLRPGNAWVRKARDWLVAPPKAR